MSWTLTGAGIQDTLGVLIASATVRLTPTRLPCRTADGVVLEEATKAAVTGGVVTEGGIPGVSVPSVPGTVWRVTIGGSTVARIADPGDGATVDLRDHIHSGSTPVPESEAALLRRELHAVDERLTLLEAGGPSGAPGFYSGNGPPSTIVGAPVGAHYLDLTTQTLYKLGG